jgi:hypothetical protein
MGTTIISVIIQGNEANFCLVGDSRAYHVRKGHAIWRTKDHTRVQMLLDQGTISAEEAKDHPESGMLTRALGHSRMADGRPLEPHVDGEALVFQEQDTIVMSSDGLHDLVDDWEIAKVVAGKQPDEIAQELIDLACERGGHDNVTVAVIVAGRRAGDFDADYVSPNATVTDDVSEDDHAESTFDGIRREEGGDMYTDESVDLPLPGYTEDTMAEGNVAANNKKMIIAGVVAVTVLLLGLAGLALAAVGFYWLM